MSMSPACCIAMCFAAVVAAGAEVNVGDWALGGAAVVRCNNPGDWKLTAAAVPSGEEGVSLVRVSASSPQPAKKPVFSVKVRIPGGEAPPA